MLAKLASKYPLSFHCVGVSLGSSDKIRELKQLVDLYKPAFDGTYLHDLLPIPYNDEAFELFRTKVDFVQTYLDRQILIANPSLYISFPLSLL